MVRADASDDPARFRFRRMEIPDLACAQHVEGYLAQDRQIVVPAVTAVARPVLVEGDIEDPRRAVLDPPTRPDNRSEGLHRRGDRGQA